MARRRTVREIKRFEVYWVSLDPTIGHEINKTRPCVVITYDEMNELLGTVIIAPITSTLRNLPFRCDIQIKGKQGQVALDQMRTVDKLRLGKLINVVSGKARQEILEKLSEMFAK